MLSACCQGAQLTPLHFHKLRDVEGHSHPFPKCGSSWLELFQLAGALDLGVPMVGGGFCHFQLSLFQSWKLCRDSCVMHVAARQQRLITALAIHGTRPRSYLAGLLWPESGEARALESLRV